MPSPTLRRLPLALLLAVACRGERGREADTAGTLRVTVDTIPVAQVAIPGETVGIVTEDGAVRMALAGDRVVVRLSDAVLAEVRREMAADSARSGRDGLGGMIGGVVRSAVEGALSHAFEYPLADIEDVRYDGTRIDFDFRTRGPHLVEQTKVKDRPLLESFAPDDARRFVDAVRAAKSSL